MFFPTLEVSNLIFELLKLLIEKLLISDCHMSLNDIRFVRTLEGGLSIEFTF